MTSLAPSTQRPPPPAKPREATLAARALRLLGSGPPGERTLGQRLAHGALWSLAGAVVSRGLALLGAIVVARLLGKERFGELGIVQATVAMFQVFADFGLGVTATKYVAELRGTDPDRAGRIAGLSGMVAGVTGAALAVGLVLAAPLIAERALGEPALAPLLRLSAALLLFTALNGAQVGALAGFEAFRSIARVNLVSGLLAFPLLVGGALMAGVHGAILGLTASMAATCLLNHRALGGESRAAGVRITARGSLGERRILLGFSLPAALAGVAMSPVQWAAQALLVNQPSGLSQLGVLNAVMRLKQAPEAVLASLLRPLLPVLSEQLGRRDGEGYGKTLTSAYLLSAGLLVPFGILVAGAPDLALLPFGPDFAGHSGLVQWLMLHAAVVGLGAPLASILASSNQMWTALAFNSGWAVLFLGASLWLVPRWGGAGLAAAMVLAQVAATAPMLAFLSLRRPLFRGRFPVLPMLGLVPLLVGGCAAASMRLPAAASLAVAAAVAALFGAWLLRIGRAGPAATGGAA